MNRLARLGRALGIALGWLLLLAAAGAFGARYVPEATHTLLIVAALSPYLVLVAVPALLIFGLTRRRVGAMLATALLVAAIAVELPHVVGSDRVPAGTVALRVLTANLFEGRADPQALIDIATQRADVVALQELTPLEVDALTARGIDAHFPYKVMEAKRFAGGVGVWSRHPITQSARIDGYELGFLTAAIRVPGAELDAVVASMHVVGPTVIADWRRELAMLGRTLNQMAGAAGRQPTIVAGDFNATDDMRSFRRLLGSGFRDAGEQSGAGLARTYPANSDRWPPYVGIDHILTLNAAATGTATVRVPGSDHRGIVTTVHLPVSPGQ